MSQDYNIVSEFKGYVTKPDPTNTDERYLTAGSFNVLCNDEEKIEGRKGYSLLGAASTDRTPILSEFTWNTSSGTELLMRGIFDTTNDGTLQFYYNSVWNTLADGFTTAEFGFPKSSKSGYWKDSEGIDLLLFVAKDANLYEWNGAVSLVDSVTTNTIVIQGDTIAIQRYDTTSGTLVIDGTEYAYTGTSTNTFTGVTPDPSAGGVVNGDVVFQKIGTNANTPASGLTNDLIEILENQVWIGDFSSREVYKSVVDNYTDFSTIATPRNVGDAFIQTIDNVPVGFVVQEDKMYVTAGKSDWYETEISLQNSGTAFIENIKIKKLKNASQQAALEADLIANIKNEAVFISNEPTLDSLGRVENINTPQSKPLSDPIKPDFDSYDFTGGDIEYFKNQIFITLPAESVLLIYDLINGWWQPPQKISLGKLSVYNNQLIGHSNLVAESYVLFEDDTSDNGGVINMQAVFAYQNLGKRALKKGFDEYYTEGYISPSTKLTLTLEYEYEGADGEKEFIIDGSDETITFGKGASGGLGSLPLGGGPLGTLLESATDLKKFRVCHGMRSIDHFEGRAIYSTTDDDAQFEILAHGPQARISQNQNNSITK